MKMADLTIREKFFDDLAKGARWDVGVSIARGNPLPLDANSVFESYADLEAYAAGVLAYPGQIVAVVNADSTGVYYLDQEKAIKPVGVIPAGDNLSIDMDENDVVSLHNFGKVFYKYIAENGDVAAHYEKVEVSNDNPWVAGLEPRVVTEDGKLVIGWYEPNPTTIDGVNDQVAAVQGTVEDLVDSVGAPSTENSEATGLYKEVEDVQEDVEELIDAVGNSDDALDENVQTIWAHINNHTDRIEVLEAIDHDAYATKVALAEEVANRENAIEGLQNQINLIMDNPDTENVIDSISEFMTYISEHGEIAEGFRTDIDKNKEDIGKEIEAARAAEGALSDRLDVLEAIDHDAYIAADATLKEELIADAASKYATTGALEEAVNDLDARLDALEEVDNATQEELDAVEGKADSNTAAIQNLSGRLDGIVAQGGDPNVINNIKVNGVVQAIAEDKSVDIAVPTKFSDITDDSGFDARITAAKE
jgi:prefoldin subunit 5